MKKIRKRIFAAALAAVLLATMPGTASVAVAEETTLTDGNPETVTEQTENEADSAETETDVLQEPAEEDDGENIPETENGDTTEIDGKRPEEAAPPKEDEKSCDCGILCTEDSVNGDCPVCGAEGADLSACTGEEKDNNTSGSGTEDDTDTEKCICELLCTQGRINGDCPICGAEEAALSVCEGTALTGNETDEENTEVIETEDVDTEDTSLCAHHKEHTEDCGYLPTSEDGEGSSCAYECRICPIEELIAALPDKVTEDNAKEVQAQLDKILALYGKLTEEEQEQIDLTRCLELQEVLDAANVPVTADVAAGDVVINSISGQIITFTADQCGSSCQGHTITQNVSVAYNTTILVESGTHNITFSGLNLTTAKVGVMPGGTMNLTIAGTNSISAVSQSAGIYVPVGATLVITEQSTGSLDVSGSGSGSGIGGGVCAPNDTNDTGGYTGNLSCGTVIINGGTIIANGGDMSAGIGGAGGNYGSSIAGNGGTVIINGGTVTATGGNDEEFYGGAGIGGGSYSGKSGSGGTLTINGGQVTLDVGTHNDQWGIAYGFGRGSGDNSNAGTLTLADESCLTLAAGTTLDPNGTYRFTGNPTADMITVPSDMHYTSADMAAEIAQKVTLSGKEICGQTFQIDMEGWSLSVTKKSDLEYTAVYSHAEKGSVSQSVIILPCLHGGGAALTHHDKEEADCTHTGILEYWDCSVCGKNFSDENGQTEITDTEIPIAAHTLTHHEKVEADCTHTGILEYWDCSVCGKKFSDKDGQTEITDTEIPITAHTLTHYEGKEADCTQAGNVEYWDCSVCGKKFSDNDCQTEISDADVEIKIKPHTLARHARVEAGCLTEGNIEYWSCNICNKLFSDKDGTKEVTDVKIPAAGHNYSDWQSSGNGTHTRTCQRLGCGSAETGDCSGGTATYTEKAVCTVCNHEYGDVLKDSGAPTGEISIRTSKWNSFLNTITFGLFFKNTEKVTITARDQESGVKSVSYYISDKGMSEQEVKALGAEWTDTDRDTVAFNISGDQSCVVYAKITDNQGNMTYISSDGMVFDGTNPAIIGVENGKTYCEQQAVTVKDENLESVTVNGKAADLSDGSKEISLTLDAASGVQTIEAKDKAGNTVSVTVTLAHTLTHYESKEADCTQAGNVEYWGCSVCGKKFSDQGGRTEITDTEIPITAHTMVHHEGKEADCTQAGNVEYWGCSVCGKKFSDQDGQTEISDADVEIPSKPHTLTHHAGIEAGCLTDGKIEYWDCSVCGKLFSDKDGTKEVTDVKIPAAGHNYSGWQSNGNGTHTRTCQRPGCDFTETKDCSGGTATYTEKAVCTVCNHEYGEILKDSGAPTGEISIRTSKWDSFLNTITFGLFFKNTEKVTITAGDKESGVKSVSYYISGIGMSEEAVKALTTEWAVVDGNTVTFNISGDQSCVVYAKITDNQGNMAYISSDGMVFDGTAPFITGVEDGRAYCEQQTVTATVRDENLESVTVNGKKADLPDGGKELSLTFDAASDVQTIIIEAKDKAGNASKVTVYMGYHYGTEWKTDKENHWHECTGCGLKLDLEAHSPDGGTVTKEPTKTETGTKTYKCTVCGHVIRTEEIPKLPQASGGEGNNGSDKENNDSGGQENNNNGNENTAPGTPETQPVKEPQKDTGTHSTAEATPIKPESNATGSGNGVEQDNAPQSRTALKGREPFIKGADGKIGWDVIRAEEEKAKDGNVINVDMNGAVVVPGDIFDSIKGRDITITFDMGNGILWSVDGKSITTDKAGDIDFSVKTGVSIIPVDIVNNVTGENYSIQLSLAYSGEFGFTAVLSVNIGEENAGYTASLYYYNKDTGELEFICADEVAQDGAVLLSFTHASDYVIMVSGASTETALESGTETAGDAMQAQEGETGDGGSTPPSPKEAGDAESSVSHLALWIALTGAAAALLAVAGILAWKQKRKDGEEA